MDFVGAVAIGQISFAPGRWALMSCSFPAFHSFASSGITSAVNFRELVAVTLQDLAVYFICWGR